MLVECCAGSGWLREALPACCFLLLNYASNPIPKINSAHVSNYFFDKNVILSLLLSRTVPYDPPPRRRSFKRIVKLLVLAFLRYLRPAARWDSRLK